MQQTGFSSWMRWQHFKIHLEVMNIREHITGDSATNSDFPLWTKMTLVDIKSLYICICIYTWDSMWTTSYAYICRESEREILSIPDVICKLAHCKIYQRVFTNFVCCTMYLCLSRSKLDERALSHIMCTPSNCKHSIVPGKYINK